MKIFGPKIQPVIGGWRKLHNEEFHGYSTKICYIGNQIKQDEMGGACGT
jgi:hypothetical protein